MRAKEDWRRDLDGLLEGERVQRVREVLESRIKEMQAQLGEHSMRAWSASAN